MGFAVNLDQFFVGSSFRWRQLDERLQAIYGNDSFKHEVGFNVGWLFNELLPQ